MTTIQVPDLNFEDAEVQKKRQPSTADFAAFLKRTTDLSDAQIRERLEPKRDPDGSRVRARWSTSEPVIVRTGRGRRTVHRGGLVELVHLPGFDHDYRVFLRVAEGESPSVEVEAFVVIGRVGGRPVTATTMRTVPVGEITQKARAALSILLVAGEGPVTVTDAELRALRPKGETSERRGRRTSAQVDTEAEQVARLYLEGANYRAIAHRLGWGGEGATGEARARDRARRAEAMGLLGPARGTRGRRA